jgi:hypothetical protein
MRTRHTTLVQIILLVTEASLSLPPVPLVCY